MTVGRDWVRRASWGAKEVVGWGWGHKAGVKVRGCTGFPGACQQHVSSDS